MSNIAGKSYAINVVTPLPHSGMPLRVIFKAVQTPLLRSRLKGLITLSLIHYAKWAIVKPGDWPRLSSTQPKEDLEYAYEFFFSNFNGSWNQYIDSFSMTIPDGLNLFWFGSVNYPKSVPITSFHSYINSNQVRTLHYYNAYPLASSNDVKAAQRVSATLTDLAATSATASSEEFAAAYKTAVLHLQHDLAPMEETPVISLANQATQERNTAEEVGYS